MGYGIFLRKERKKNIELPPRYDTLEEYSWDEIGSISSLGLASEYFTDFLNNQSTKEVIINNERHKVRIIGINQETMATYPGDFPSITFEMVNVLDKPYQLIWDYDQCSNSSTRTVHYYPKDTNNNESYFNLCNNTTITDLNGNNIKSLLSSPVKKLYGITTLERYEYEYKEIVIQTPFFIPSYTEYGGNADAWSFPQENISGQWLRSTTTSILHNENTISLYYPNMFITNYRKKTTREGVPVSYLTRSYLGTYTGTRYTDSSQMPAYVITQDYLIEVDENGNLNDTQPDYINLYSSPKGYVSLAFCI